MAIQTKIYGDNDCNVGALDLPTGLTVTWFMATIPVTYESVAIHADVSGTLTETGTKPQWMTDADLPDSSTGRYYTDVLEGAAISDHLMVSPYLDAKIALVVRSGQDLRVYGRTTPTAGRLVT